MTLIHSFREEASSVEHVPSSTRILDCVMYLVGQSVELWVTVAGGGSVGALADAEWDVVLRVDEEDVEEEDDDVEIAQP